MNEPLRLHALPAKTEGTPHMATGAPAAPAIETTGGAVPPAAGQGADKRKKGKDGDAPATGARKKILGSIDFFKSNNVTYGQCSFGSPNRGKYNG